MNRPDRKKKTPDWKRVENINTVRSEMGKRRRCGSADLIRRPTPLSLSYHKFRTIALLVQSAGDGGYRRSSRSESRRGWWQNFGDWNRWNHQEYKEWLSRESLLVVIDVNIVVVRVFVEDNVWLKSVQRERLLRRWVWCQRMKKINAFILYFFRY